MAIHPLLLRHAHVHPTPPWATAGAAAPLGEDADLPPSMRTLSGTEALAGGVLLFLLAYGRPLLAKVAGR